jgi:hypothetical protein
MDRRSGCAALAALLCGALLLAPPALAQSAAPPGSTLNGTVPTSEGNVWNGLDHQPTPAEIAPATNSHQQAKQNHKLGKLDQQLLNDPLPKSPAGAPPVSGNGP